MKNFYIISGSSGSGKTTLLELLSRDLSIEISVSYTTRKKRKYEIDGVHYNFISEEKFKEYLNVVFPNFSKKEGAELNLSRNANRALEVVDTQPGAEFGRGTWWQAFNSVTYLTDHELGRSQDSRLNSAWLGVNKDRKNMALEKAVEFAEAA